MSQAHSLLPFGPGQTFNDLDTDGTTVTMPWLEGHEFEVEDYEAPSGSGSVARRTGWVRRYRVVRNSAGIALSAKYLVQFSTTAGHYGKRVVGYNETLARKAYPIDDRLSTTVTSLHLFLIGVGGPFLCITHPVGDGTNVISVGDKLVAESAAASTVATTAGRVVPQVLTGATALLANQIQNYVGHALSAKTTANTNADILVLIEHRIP